VKGVLFERQKLINKRDICHEFCDHAARPIQPTSRGPVQSDSEFNFIPINSFGNAPRDEEPDDPYTGIGPLQQVPIVILRGRSTAQLTAFFRRPREPLVETVGQKTPRRVNMN
jgi:hypothetical protein